MPRPNVEAVGAATDLVLLARRERVLLQALTDGLHDCLNMIEYRGFPAHFGSQRDHEVARREHARTRELHPATRFQLVDQQSRCGFVLAQVLREVSRY